MDRCNFCKFSTKNKKCSHCCMKLCNNCIIVYKLVCENCPKKVDECDFCGNNIIVEECENCNKKICKKCAKDIDFLHAICKSCPIKRKRCYSCNRLFHKKVLSKCPNCGNLSCNLCFKTCNICDNLVCKECNNDYSSNYTNIFEKCYDCGYFVCRDCFNDSFMDFACEFCEKFSCPRCYPLKDGVCLACDDYGMLLKECDNNFPSLDKLVFHKKWINKKYNYYVFNKLYTHMFNTINELTHHIQSLELAIEYMPGGPKYLEAKEDFESRFPLEHKN